MLWPPVTLSLERRKLGSYVLCTLPETAPLQVMSFRNGPSYAYESPTASNVLMLVSCPVVGLYPYELVPRLVINATGRVVAESKVGVIESPSGPETRLT